MGMQLEMWPLTRLVHYFRNPRKNDHVVDRMMSSIQEFAFKVPVLARSNGDVIDGRMVKILERSEWAKFYDGFQSWRTRRIGSSCWLTWVPSIKSCFCGTST